MKIAFIGGGNMAEAIISALVSAGLEGPSEISVSDISEARRAVLKEKYGVRVKPDNSLEGQEIVLLAIKPQVLAEIMPQLQPQLAPSQLVLSIIAGKSLDTLRRGLKHDRLVRSMPNTPAQIREGTTVWTATERVTAEQKKAAASILGVLGPEIFVADERFLDMATAVSGSGPAYLFFFAEALISAAEDLGFNHETAQKLVMQTLLGSLHLWQKSGRSPQDLRRQVTSPGGTTAEAISVFEQAGFQNMVERAVRAAHARARELGS